MSLPRIGWIGTGIMGASMAGHLLDKGHEVAISTRTRERAAHLLERGATWRETPAAAAADADVVMTMVGYPSDVREVMLGPDGVLAGALAGSVVVDFTTSEPSLAREIHALAKTQDVQALDAPVSGGDVGARAASLVIMVGGDDRAFDRVLPVLESLGSKVVLEGGPGAGQHTKVVNQISIASGMVGLCEGMLYAARSGLDVERVLATISGGAADSWSMSNLGPRILRDDFAPGFKVDHFVKDLGIALDEARRMELDLPGLRLAQDLYLRAQAAGQGESGTQSLIRALAELSGAQWPPEA